MKSALPSAVQARILLLGDNMGHSVKYAKVSVKRRNNAILRFSTKLAEMTMPEEPSYATAIKLAEALKDIGYALDTCYEGKKAGKSPEYVLEMRICKDTVSHQLTREGNAADGQLPSLHIWAETWRWLTHNKQAIIKFAWRIYYVRKWNKSLCQHGWHVTKYLPG